MIEVGILNYALEFAEERKSKYTGCIHFKNDREETRDVIPLVENVLYAIAMVASLSKEKAEKGLSFLERLFHFSTEDGFVGCMHDFPQVYRDRPNAWIALSLSFFLKNYSKVIPKAARELIEAQKEKLFDILTKRELKEIDQYIFDTARFKSEREDFDPSNLEELEILTLCKLLMEEEVTLPWHRELGCYAGPLEGVYYTKHQPQPSLISQLATGGQKHVSALYAALLPKKGLDKLIYYPTCERDDLFVGLDGKRLSIHFDDHSMVATGDLDVQVEDDHIQIIINDEFEEVAFYLSNPEKCQILVEEERATAFYPNQTLTLATENKQLTLSFLTKNQHFMGHLMRGNRETQLLDCEQSFTQFDHKILIRQTT